MTYTGKEPYGLDMIPETLPEMVERVTPACQVELVRASWDENAYPCSRANWAVCSDSGISLCKKHSRECPHCHDIFSPGCIDAHVAECEG